MILSKRIPRELLRYKVRYFSIFILIVVGFGIICGGIIGNDSILHTVEKYQNISNVEDGEFTTTTPLDDDALYLLADHGVEIEEAFYTDVDLKNNTTLRIFRNRNRINTIILDEGKLPVSENSIVIEKHYASANQITIGNSLLIDGREFIVSGIGSVPDYNLVIANPTDLASDPGAFSVAFTSETAFADLLDRGNSAFIFGYAFVNSGDLSDSEIKNLISEESTLSSFLIRNANNRIEEYEGEVRVTNNSTLVFGIIFSILMAYVLVVFVQNNIEKESGVIGTFYSMGYKKHELVRHYMILPVIVVTAGTVIGILMGILVGIPLLTDDTIEYYSFPMLEVSYSPTYMIYSILVPPLTTAIVCFFSISKKLSVTPLALLRKTPTAKSNRSISVPAKDAIGILRFRQFTKEFRANLIMVFGLLVSIFLLVMSVSIWGSLEHYAEQVDDSVPYQYQYNLTSPLHEIPDNTTEAVIKRLSVYSSQSDQNLDVIVLGLPVENPYYSLADITGDKQVYISDSLVDKLNISLDSQLVLIDELENNEYTLQAVAEHEAANGLYVFMEISAMRNLLEYEDDYYNTLLSNDMLELDSSYVLSTTTTEDVKNAAVNMLEQMEMMIGILIFGAIIIFIVVLYLLLKAMIDRSTYNISLLKTFGYKNPEINKIYLGASFYTIVTSVIVAVPLGRLLMESIFPYFVAHLSVSIKVYIYPYMYAMVVAIVFICYFIINALLRRQLNRISLVEILKDRE